MSGVLYHCCDEKRREALLDEKAPAGLTGIDYVEVFVGETTLLSTEIILTLVKPLDVATGTIGLDNVRLTGGVRFPPPKMGAVTGEPAGPVAKRFRISIPGNQPTDFSLYRLTLVAGPKSDAPPSFVDPRLASVDINFKVECPSEGDCEQACEEPPLATADAVFNYRARDWPGFRQLMLDRLAALIPDFHRDDPLDLTTTLVEALAAEHDRLSYRLDWIGTEAALATARSRTSAARHARLVGYTPGEGVSARTFALFTLQGVNRLDLPSHMPLLVQQEGLAPVVPASAWPLLIAQRPIVFETLADATIWEWRNAIELYTWLDDECVLPAGATSATLVDASAGSPDALAPGDLLLLREIASPETGLSADARPERRHVVRLTSVTRTEDKLGGAAKLVDVAWSLADALPFDLVVQTQATEVGKASRTVVCADAAANLALCDHGLSLPPAPALDLPSSALEFLQPRLDPPAPPDPGRPWRPTLDRADLSRGPAVEDSARPASLLRDVAPADAVPRLKLIDSFSKWEAKLDLLGSDPFSRDFVIESGMDGRAQLRFGDGVHGLAPASGGEFSVEGRFGFGLEGNIGPDALGHVVLADAPPLAKLSVTNPLPALSGADPEPITSVRLNAPYAYRRRDRAVTPADYAEMARRHPDVSAALARPRWTGGFQTMLVYVDRRDGRPVDATFRAEIGKLLERYRLMGMDVAVRGAVLRPLDIALFVCAAPGALRSAVAGRVRDALRPRRRDGGKGFFHPDRFSFGSPLRLSALVGAVMAVHGVQSVEVKTFQRFARPDAGELEAGVIRPSGPEVLQLDDDPSFPERGRLRIDMGGGR